jgi:hypothetical protein
MVKLSDNDARDPADHPRICDNLLTGKGAADGLL